MNYSIRWRLILSLAIPLVLVLGLSLLVNWWEMREDAIAEMRRDLKVQAVSFADRLDTRFAGVELIAQSAADVVEARGGNRRQMIGILRASLGHNPLISAARIGLEPNGTQPHGFAIQLRKSRDGQVEPQAIHTKMDYLQAQWFDHCKRRNTGLWSDAEHDPMFDGEATVTYSVPFNNSAGNFGGVIALTIRLVDIQHLLTWGSGNIEEFAIIDNKERFISHPDPDQLLDDRMRQLFDERLPRGGDELMAATMTEPVILPIRMQPTRQAAGLDRSEQSYWLAFAPIKTTNWIFVTAVPQSIIVPELMESVYQRTAFGLLILGVVMGVIAFTSIKVARPIERIATAVDEVSQGNFDVEVKDSSKGKGGDEVARLAHGFNVMVTQIKKQIRALTRETAARERVESELRIARNIQTSLLPRAFPPFPERHEFSLHAINLPAKEVAGDFFDFFFTDDGRLTIVIADVSGKGVPAAMLMAVTRTLIRNRATMGAPPSEIVEHTNDLLFQDNQGTMFVTMFVCQYDPGSGEMTYVNAGHPLPYRCCRGKEPELFGEVTAPLVGACEAGPMGPFEQEVEILQPGETLLMFTDGVTEARSPQDTMLHDAGLVEALKARQSDDARELCDYIAQTVNEFQANNPIDDVTVVALRRNP